MRAGAACLCWVGDHGRVRPRAPLALTLTNRLYTAAVSMDALLLPLPLLQVRLGEKHSVQRSSSMLLLPAGVSAGGRLLLALLCSSGMTVLVSQGRMATCVHRVANVQQAR